MKARALMVLGWLLDVWCGAVVVATAVNVFVISWPAGTAHPPHPPFLGV